MSTGLRFDNLHHLGSFVKGRAAHHKRMQRVAADRRHRLLALVQSGQFEPKASQAFADALGVDRSTLWRDLQALDFSAARCTHCGQLLPAAFEQATVDD